MRRSDFRRRRALKLERLDKREMLAGDCIAILFAGDLTVVCDNNDNSLTVSEDIITGDLLVAGRFGTRINGVPDATKNFGQVSLDDVRIFTFGGDDTVFLSSLSADDIYVSTGSGDDDIIAAFLEVDELKIAAGRGNDNIGVLSVNAEEVKVRAGAGDDVVSVNVVTAEEIKLHGGSGTMDQLILNPATVIGELVVEGFELP